MPLQATSGAASYDGFGGGVAVVPTYIEEVFSTYLYTGTGAAQTITNGIDLSTKGGLVWMKSRTEGSTKYFGNNVVISSATGLSNAALYTDSTNGFITLDPISSLTTSGFALTNTSRTNYSGDAFVSWTFRKQPKFFDVVTWTGTGVDGQVIPHSLGVKPSVIIVKRTDTTSNWQYNDANDNYLILNSTAASAGSNRNGGWIPQYNTTATTLTTQNYSGNSNVNASGGTYVAYLFAHNAGGFGLTGTDNVISCGSFTTDGSGLATVSLGYEPQWVLFKQTDGVDSWYLNDIMRGMSVSASSNNLSPNLSAAESAGGYDTKPTATGFNANSGIANKNYIYIAIRRGPMKVPTTGTSVFAPVATSGNPSSITAGFPVDFALGKEVKNGTGYGNYAIDRLRGGSVLLETNTTGAEYTSQTFKFDSNTQFLQSAGGLFYGPSIYWLMRRAPGFFDVVCYTGTGSNLTLPHNLTVAPELLIAKVRSTGSSWGVSTSTDWTKYLLLNSTNAQASASLFGTPDATNFYPTASGGFSGSGNTYVAYLFASCPGVQSIQSYVGDGTTGRTINCGFTGGARFVCIKATSTTGSWWTFDSARGIVTNNDPALQLNSTAAEVTSADAIDTAASGFIVNQEATCSLNASGVSYLVWAIA